MRLLVGFLLAIANIIANANNVALFNDLDCPEFGDPDVFFERNLTYDLASDTLHNNGDKYGIFYTCNVYNTTPPSFYHCPGSDYNNLLHFGAQAGDDYGATAITSGYSGNDNGNHLYQPIGTQSGSIRNEATIAPNYYISGCGSYSNFEVPSGCTYAFNEDRFFNALQIIPPTENPIKAVESISTGPSEPKRCSTKDSEKKAGLGEVRVFFKTVNDCIPFNQFVLLGRGKKDISGPHIRVSTKNKLYFRGTCKSVLLAKLDNVLECDQIRINNFASLLERCRPLWAIWIKTSGQLMTMGEVPYKFMTIRSGLNSPIPLEDAGSPKNGDKLVFAPKNHEDFLSEMIDLIKKTGWASSIKDEYIKSKNKFEVEGLDIFWGVVSLQLEADGHANGHDNQQSTKFPPNHVYDATTISSNYLEDGYNDYSYLGNGHDTFPCTNFETPQNKIGIDQNTTSNAASIRLEGGQRQVGKPSNEVKIKLRPKPRPKERKVVRRTSYEGKLILATFNRMKEGYFKLGLIASTEFTTENRPSFCGGTRDGLYLQFANSGMVLYKGEFEPNSGRPLSGKAAKHIFSWAVRINKSGELEELGKVENHAIALCLIPRGSNNYIALTKQNKLRSGDTIIVISRSLGEKALRQLIKVMKEYEGCSRARNFRDQIWSILEKYDNYIFGALTFFED